jgi:hypothetical protein
MADGTTSATGTSADAADSGLAGKIAFWFVGTPRNVFRTLAITAFLPLAAALAWHVFATKIFTSPNAWAWYAIASTAFWLPLLLMLLDSSDNMAQGPGLALPLTTLGVLLLAVCLVVWDFETGSHLLVQRIAKNGTLIVNPVTLGATFAIFVLAFAPRIWNATQVALFKRREIKARADEVVAKRNSEDAATRANAEDLALRQSEHDDAEALGATLATLGVAAICTLAWWAGREGGAALGPTLGVAITCGVIGLFTVVIFLDLIAESAPVRGAGRILRSLSRRMAWLAGFYNAIDTVLVRIGAHAAGMDHHTMSARYVVLGGTLFCLSILAWCMPAPFGLIPAAIGFVLALSVSRLWSWVEEDRTLAAITRFNPDAPQRIGFGEDYRDEALLGFIFVLVLIPIAMAQADAGKVFGRDLFEGAGKADLGPWLGYFGFELAKALPVVDWADIYHFSPDKELLKPVEGIGDHAVFAARAMVDLVLIASLLQAIGIATRNRQQKALFAAGQIDRLDELVEKAELAREVARPTNQWFKHGIDFRRYNEDRLKELHSSSKKLRLRTYIETIFRQSGRTLDPAIVVLARMAANHAPETQLYRTLEAVGREPPPLVGDLVEIMTSIRKQSGLRDFKLALIDLAAKVGTTDVEDMTMRIMVGSLNDAQMYTRWHAAETLRAIAPRLPDAAAVANDIAELEAHDHHVFGSRQDLRAELLTALRNRLEDLRPSPPDEVPAPPEPTPT